ncbi:MAG TPA: DNA-binding response regulator, partial [Cyanobacteria bacterium UBA11371]|nr:DNA-binding response regulator [Cyanobacteria bacterium UBA11371]
MKKILVIEDSKPFRNQILKQLESKGFYTIAAENGFDGIKLAKEQLPDLVICDILMPDLDGYSVLIALRQNPDTAIIPFIFV